MINNDRIVPVQKIDLLSLYGTILRFSSGDDANYTVLQATDITGDFEASTGIYLANQPVKTLNFTGATGSVYFVAAYDFAGITVDGAAATIADGSATVKPDGAALYLAMLEDGEVEISEITPNLA